MERSGWKLNNNAFSLLELVITIAILSVGIVFVMQALSFSGKASVLFSDYLKASTLAEDTIQGLELREAGQLMEAGNSQDKKDKFNLYSEIKLDSKLNLYELDLKIDWPLAKKIEELKLSTYYRK